MMLNNILKNYKLRKGCNFSWLIVSNIENNGTVDSVPSGRCIQSIIFIYWTHTWL